MERTGEEREPPKLREIAYDSFTRHLLANAVRPGQFVSQRELVELTGLTLGAIRELVPRLEAEGLVKTVPQRGMQVAHIDLGLIRDAYQFRLFLEKEAVALFVETASDETIAAIRARHEDILRRAEQGVTSPDLAAEAQAVDWGFHDTIIDALSNEIIAKAYRVNSIKIRLIRQELTRIDGLVVPVMNEHLTVIAAMETRDPTLAASALAKHIDSARRRALGLR
ncbi:MAG: GntR family transcriptional regulator [Chelatococcus sp.]|jgi:DNA-binding GntR family transcriptional regulator|uniref:GntR family transcriptional regulator n=1 Tax=unclassified Chelatococcus TaxID=2638111 RepID=UPI001BD1B985|nr:MULTISPECIES: GntR family transcriptional regulator [unclassified Chelatococcus]CAH1668664.1 DNA-binding GntR family transcriptional regulator [Hyphomicrobiales bacterium]MBS7739429.1 GntR family transcriptional regulator [Chelatococcus sp. HY11]MBX3536513.1 GntR family transcriptional regulator [Chelatococcus sp.]MBX3543798.1 GntR family transcriptional regulator [Chelatococcus sp.]MCO5076036.1 GntR family transcriptional regulator [Chelatococcus sp.]